MDPAEQWQYWQADQKSGWALWVVSQAWACQGTLNPEDICWQERKGDTLLVKGSGGRPRFFWSFLRVLIFHVPSGLVLWLVYAHTAFTVYPLLLWPVLCLLILVLASLSSKILFSFLASFFQPFPPVSHSHSYPAPPFPQILHAVPCMPVLPPPPLSGCHSPTVLDFHFTSVSGVFVEPVLAFSLLLWLNRGIMARCLQH